MPTAPPTRPIDAGRHLYDRDILILAVLSIFALVFLRACDGADKAVHPPSHQSSSVKSAAGEIGTRVASINAHTDRIEAQAPQVKPETDGIRTDTAALSVVQGKLDAAQESIRVNEKECEALRGKVDGLEKKNRELQADRNSLLSRLLAGLAVVAVIGIPLSIFGAHSIALAAFSGTLFAVAVGAQTALEHKGLIAAVLAGLIVAGAVWLFAVQRKSLSEVVETAEEWKPLTAVRDEAKKIADEIQSPRTQKIVATVRKKLGVA